MMASLHAWVHPTSGILRNLQAVFSLRVYTALKPCPRPPTRKKRKPLGGAGSRVEKDIR